MVRGLNIFRDHFSGFDDRYVLIGGAAVDVAMDAAGLQFRVTKDLDIVLHVEALDAHFAQAFWAFVADGGYESRERSTAKPTLYRFSKPTDESFPPRGRRRASRNVPGGHDHVEPATRSHYAATLLEPAQGVVDRYLGRRECGSRIQEGPLTCEDVVPPREFESLLPP